MRTKNPDYLVKRGRIWYARFTPGPGQKEKVISTGCTDKRDAAARAKLLRSAYQEKRWDLLQKVRPGHGIATVEQLIAAYTSANQIHRMVRPMSERNAIICLKAILQETGHDPDQVKCDVLTADLLMNFEAQRLTAVTPATPDRLDRCKRTAASTINQARSLLSARARQKAYTGRLVLPDLTEFMAYKSDNPHKEPEFADDALWTRTVAAAGKLRTENPALWIAWLLCFELGMRKSEVLAARRMALVDRRVGQDLVHYYRVRIQSDHKPKGDGSTREIPMANSVYEDLVTMGGDEYLLPVANATARDALITHELSKWMRGIGWSRLIYTQCAHQLRREKGKRVYEEQGPAAAKEFLGHRDISTTIRHYARFTKPLIPLAPAVPAAVA